MRIVSIGGGPAGLYLGILMKKLDPDCTVNIIERNRPDDTFGFGVVFSDATLGHLAKADPETYSRITEHFAHWDDIDIHIGDRVFRSTGHGFCGLSRQTLLDILQRRCAELGVNMEFEREVTDLAEVGEADLIVAADGVASGIRDAHADAFRPDIDYRPNRFVWLGTTYPFEAFTFYFNQTEHGLFRVHAYRYEDEGSTFIVECTEDTWRRAGLDRTDEDQTIAYLERVFENELAGHRLTKNRSIWRSFPTIKNERWSHDNVVLLGDAVHTAHFSIGSGTKLAMEDCIALTDAIGASDDIASALERYDRERRPEVERLQRAAQVSLEWFENTERYMQLEPIQFAYSLLTRSLRVTHTNLALRDPEFVAEIEHWFAGEHGTPPMLAPLAIGDMTVDNRVVLAPVALHGAADGVVGDRDLVHYASRATGGVGLLVTETSWVREPAAPDAAPGLWNGAQASAWQAVVSAAHDAGARIAAQLGCPVPAALARVDLDGLAAEFATAAKRALGAGFDMVVIDAAGGGGLHQLISGLSAPGGHTQTAPLSAIVTAVRAVVPAEVPLGVRLCADDLAPGGIDGGAAVELARAARAAGAAAVFVTTGGHPDGGAVQHGRLFQVPHADRIRNEVGIVTVAEGGIDSHDDINSVLAAGRADLCALDQALIYDPYFVRRAAAAQGRELPWPRGYESASGYTPR